MIEIKVIGTLNNVWNLNFKGQEITFIYADIEFQNLYAENQLSDM